MCRSGLFNPVEERGKKNLPELQSNRKLLMKILEKVKYLLRFFYHKQVQINFPIPILRQYIDYKWHLPEGYKICSPDANVDLKAWADLLNLDGQFGQWTSEKVKSDIVSQMITPDAASLMFFKNHLVGCSSSIDQSSPKCKLGIGMWLMINPSHRGKRKIVHALTFRSLAIFAMLNYDKVVAFTDAYRLPAIYFYLSNGCLPEYDSLYSFIQWWRIKKRLKPALERAKSHKSNWRNNGAV
jgi:hypothetical protein